MTQQQEEKLIATVGEIKGIIGNGTGVLATVRQNSEDIRELREMIPTVVHRRDMEKWIIRLLVFGQSLIILLFGTGLLKIPIP